MHPSWYQPPSPYGPPPGYGMQGYYAPPPGYYGEQYPARVGLTPAELNLTPEQLARLAHRDDISWMQLLVGAAVSAVVFIMVGRMLK